jgi:hypothetical protein
MTDVEPAAGRSNRSMFGQHRFVLDWHLPATEVDEPGSEPGVELMKR